MAKPVTNPFFSCKPNENIQNPFLALVPIRKDIPAKTSKSINNGSPPSVNNDVPSPFLKRLDPMPVPRPSSSSPRTGSNNKVSPPSSLKIGAALRKTKIVPPAVKPRPTWEKPTHFGGDEEFEDGNFVPLYSADLLNGYEAKANNNGDVHMDEGLNESSMNPDQEEDEEEPGMNPLFAAAGISEARKKIKSALENRRLLLKHPIAEADSDEDDEGR